MSFTLLKDMYSTFTLFSLLFLSFLLLGNGLGLYSNPVAAQNLNEAEVNADIDEQENKCKKDTKCKNEINNKAVVKNIIRQQEDQESSLTVKKQIFGCDNISDEGGPSETMNCRNLDNDSPNWLLCTDPDISSSGICQALHENLFDIEVLDGQNTQLQQFKGSEQGTPIENIEPGTYTVNEIKHQDNANQLGEVESYFIQCTNAGFPDGGGLVNTNSNPTVSYTICFEYEDEQGNDCSQTVVNDGEDKVCIVKNYTRIAIGT